MNTLSVGVLVLVKLTTPEAGKERPWGSTTMATTPPVVSPLLASPAAQSTPDPGLPSVVGDAQGMPSPGAPSGSGGGGTAAAQSNLQDGGPIFGSREHI